MTEPQTSDARSSGPGRIGFVLGEKQGTLTVVRVSAGGPADRAGLRVGDRIVRIDDEEAEALGKKEAAARLRGVAGARVVLSVLRAETHAPIRIQLTREAEEASILPAGTGRFVLGILGILGAVAVIVAVAWFWTSDHARTAETYVTRLEEGRPRDAYALLTGARRDELSYEAWLGAMQSSLLARSSDLRIGSTSSNSRGRGCVGVSVAADGDRVYLTVFTLADGEDIRVHEVMTNEEQSGLTPQGPWSCG